VTGAELTSLLTNIGIPLVFVVLIAYVLLMPEKAQTVAGWLWSLLARIVHRGDRTAVALRVQGHVNARARSLAKQVPPGVIGGRLKIKWSDVEQARSVLRDGEVVVFMRPSRFHEENVAHALMVYLPKAVLPRARRYLNKTTMTAADLTLAKAIIGSSASAQGVLDVFYEQHLDPACEEDEALRQKVAEMDEIDLHGWLLRVMLPEFRRLGNMLHPSEPDRRCASDAEQFVRWLHSLATRESGDQTHPLSYDGPYIRVAVIFVAIPKKLEEQGVDPYRKRAKTLVYSGRYDAVYLMARDHNMWAVREIVERMRADGRVESIEVNEFKLRPDFAKRRLDRERAVVACLVSHKAGQDEEEHDDLVDIQVDSFVPETDAASPRKRFYESDPADLARERGQLPVE